MFKNILAIIVIAIIGFGCATTYTSSGWMVYGDDQFTYTHFEQTRICSRIVVGNTTCMECYTNVEQDETPITICKKRRYW